MIYPNKFRLVIKAIAAVIVCVFTWQQISWAGAGELIANDKVEASASGVSANQLASQQAVNSSAVDLQNAIEGFSVPAAEPVVQAQSVSLPKTERSSSVLPATYYANGRMESQTLATPDDQGMIYYHYLNENWNNQGYGRVDKSYRQTAVNGELTFTYSYYADSTGRLQTKRGYSDTNSTIEVATYAYYNDIAGRLQLKQLRYADSKGMNYYEYLNEDFNGQGFGRVERSQKPYYKAWFSTPEYSYLYGYQDDVSERYAYIYAYSDMTWTNFARKSFYYDDETNYLEKETEFIGKIGSTDYHYINENWNNSGHGRKDWEKSSGMWGSYYNEYLYYDDEFGRLSHLRSYDIGYFSGQTLEYDEYYRNDATNYAEYRLYVKPDYSGNIYYHYLNRSGYVKDRSYRRDPLNGELSHSYVYVEDDPCKGIEALYGYSDSSWTNLVSTSTYYPGYQGYIKTKTLASADANGFIKYDYLNENFNSQGFGRVEKCSRATPRDGVLVITKEYFGTSSRVKIERGYADEALTKLVMTKELDESGNIVGIVYTNSATVLYYPSGRVESRILNIPDAQGMIYYHYIDEDWQASGCGRIDSAYRKSALDGELSFTYTYYADPAGLLQTKKSYSDINFTSPVNTYTYFNDITNRLQKKACPAVTTTYYNDVNNRMQSKQLASADSKGMEYYEYLNEDFNGQGFGRVERCRKPPANYTRWVGVLEASSYLYHYLDDTTERLQDVYAYNDMNWDMIRSISRYYDDENNYLEEFYSNIWNIGYLSYHYLNENWNEAGQGRVSAVEYGGVVGSGDEEWYYYDDADGRLSRKEYYAKNCYQEPYRALNRVESYYNDSTNRLESKTLAVADEQGNIYYHCINEDWQGQGVGRISSVTSAVPDSDGAQCYHYTYYDGTSIVKTKACSSTSLNYLHLVTYEYDQTGMQISRTLGQGVTYYPSGHLRSVTLPEADDAGMVYYSYLDEDWNGQGYGRVEKCRREIPAYGGVIGYGYTYFDDTSDRTQSVTTYSDADLTTLVVIYTYANDASGSLIQQIMADGSICEGSPTSPLRKINAELSEPVHLEYTEYFYDDNGVLISHREYMNNGDIIIYDDKNNVIEYTYDYSGDITSLLSTQSDMSITTSTGDIIEYKDNKIVFITCKDNGTKIFNIELDDAGNINNALVLYADGALGVIRNGELLQLVDSNGVFIRYRDGRKATEYSEATGIASYTYTLAEDNATVNETRVWSREAVCLYDAQGRPVIFTKTGGETIEYENGHIRKISAANDAIYLYTFIESEGKAVLESSYLTSDYPSAIYYVNGQISKVEYSNDGTVIKTLEYTTDSDGNPVVKVRNASGELENPDAETMSTYAFTPAGVDGRQVVVERDGIKRVYNQNGNLQALEKDGVEIGFDNGGSAINFSLEDGSILTAPKIENGEIIDGTISKKDTQGNLLYTVVYEAGKLRSYTDAQDNECTYDADGNLTKLKKRTSDGAFITYVYTSSVVTIAEVPEDARALLANDDLVVIKYENYDGGKRIIYGETKAGAFKSYAYFDDHIESTEGFVKLVGGQKIQVEDCLKKYSLDRSLQSSEAADGTLTEYHYDVTGRLSQVVVTGKDGIIKATYDYTYSEDITHVTSGNITYEYKNGVLMSAKQVVDNDAYYYSVSSGQATSDLALDRIEKAEGIITDIVFDDAGSIANYTFEKDGARYLIVSGEVTALIKPDGTKIIYGEDGYASDIIYPDGTMAEYVYETVESKSLEFDGTNVNTASLNIKGAQVLQLSSYPDENSVLLLHFDGLDGSTATADSSANANSVEFFGDAHIEGSDKKFGASSVAFDGTGYLMIPDSDDWELGSKWSVDFWVNIPVGGGGVVVGQGNAPYDAGSFYVIVSDGFVGSWWRNTSNVGNYLYTSGASSMTTNTWHHVEVTLDGVANPYIFIDGVSQVLSNENPLPTIGVSDLNDVLTIGTWHYGNSYTENCPIFKGSIDELRISKNVVRHTEDFVPSQSEYKHLYKNFGTYVSQPIEISGGKLKSISWNEVTPEGTDITVQVRTGNTLDPDDGTWSSWSEPVTDAAGSVITSSSAKYVQYKTNLLTADPLVTPQLIDDGSGAVKIEYVVARGGVLSQALDGVADKVVCLVNGTTLTLERELDAFSSALFLGFNGTAGSTSTVDSSSSSHSVTLYGDAHLDSTDSTSGGLSLALDGNDDYMTLPDSEDWNFGSDEFTIDCWVNFSDNTTGILLSQSNDQHLYMSLLAGPNSVRMFWKSGVDQWGGDFWAENTNMSLNTWHHLEVSRSGSTAYVFIDGVKQSIHYEKSFASFANYSAPLVIGCQQIAVYSPTYFKGSIDDFRILKGSIRHTENFVSAVSGAYSTSGTFTSNPIEISNAELKSISWNEVTPEGTDITVQVRTGNTLDPDDGTWSSWSEPVTDAAGSVITSSSAKYVQYKTNLLTADPLVTPQLIDDGSGAVKIEYAISSRSVISSELEGIKQKVRTILEGNAAALELQKVNGASLFLHLDGDNGSTSTTDNSFNDHPITLIGDAHLDTANPRFGASSLALDGNGDYLSIPDSDDWCLSGYSTIDACTGGIVTSNGDYVAKENAFDDDTSTYWESDGGGAGHWIEYDLGAGNTKIVQKLRIFNSGATGGPTNNGIQDFILQGSNDNSSWTNVYEGTCAAPTAWNDFTFSNATAYRYYRIYSTSSYHQDAIIVKEVELLEKSNDFTVDCWVNFENIATNNSLVGQWLSTGNNLSWLFTYDSGSLYFVSSPDGSTLSSASVSWIPNTNKWYHLAIVRAGDVLRFFVDGNQQGVDKTVSGTFFNGAAPLVVGNNLNAPGYCFNGRIDELRILKGSALWTSSFTPPNADSYENYESSGTFISDVTDINNAEIKSISWNEVTPAGTDITMQVRTGNSLNPDDGTWSSWSESVTDAAGSAIAVPTAKYIQYKIGLSTTDPTVSPRVLSDHWKDISDLYSVAIIKNNDWTTYDSLGVNVSDPADSININDLWSGSVDAAAFIDTKLRLDEFVSALTTCIPKRITADAVLNALMKDVLTFEPYPTIGSNFVEATKTIWFGETLSESLNDIKPDEAKLVEYEFVDNGGQTEKRMLFYEKKNGDKAYYSYGATGKTVVDDINGSDGKTSYYVVSQYDNNGVIQQSDYIYDDVAKNTTLQYLNGQKNKLVKHADTGDVEVLTYAYETMSNGAAAIVITDKSDPDNISTKYYVDDQLIKTVDKNQLETRYEYSADGKISTSVISRQGMDIEWYAYTYDIIAGYTIMTDSSGVKKAYDKDSRIVYIEKDNKVYSYYYAQGNTAATNSDVEKIKSYLTDLESAACTNDLLRGTDLQTANLGKPDDKYEYVPGADFAIEELTQWTDDAGDIVRYDNGNISSITKPDGTVISDISYDGTVVSAFKVAIGGIMYTIKDGFIRGEEHPDGSSITYFSNGWVSAKKDSAGVETFYIYEVPLTLNGSDSGTTYYAHIDKTEDVNSAKSLKIDDGATEGSFTSEAMEVNAEELRSIDWQGTAPDGTSVSIVIRTTNELKEDADASTWSDWSAEITNPGSLAGLSIPKGKYLQYKIVLKRNDASAASPVIDLKSIGIDILSRLSDANDPNLSHTVHVDGKDYVYDGEEKLVKIIDGTTIYAYTKEGKISSITGSDGKVTTYVYDKEHPTTLVETIVSDQNYEYHYDSPDGRLTKTIEKTSGPSNMQWEYFYNGDVISVRTTYVTKQSSVADFSSFTKDNISITDYEGITRINLNRDTPLDFGTGLDGDLVVKKGETKYLEARTYNYKSIHIEEGATVTVAPWDGTTGGKLEIKCLERAVIDGMITVDATGYPKMQGPGAGSIGQQGQDIDNSNQYERGAGGGGAGHASSGSVGQGYSYGGHTTSPGSAGVAYSDYALTTPMMGSGGGDGGCYNASSYVAPGAGGTGGGIILISAPIINVNGNLSSNGGDGSAAQSGAAGCGGGGSGGSIVLSGEQVSIVGNVTARGGYRSVGEQSGGDGSAGRIRVDYGVKEGEIYAGSYFVDAPSIYYNQLTYVSEGTLTSNAIAIDSSVRGDETTAYLNANLDIPIRANVKIETRTGSSSDIVNGEWSEWTETTLDQFGYKINSELNGFIQYRLVLTTQENDKTPSAYAVNDFAIKLTFTSTEHESKDTVTYMVQAGQEDKTHFTEPEKPAMCDQPLNRIENIKVGATTVPQADQTALVALSLEQVVARQLNEAQITDLTNTVYTSTLSGDEPVATKFKLETGGVMKAEYAQKRDGTIEHYDQDGNVRFVTDASGAILSRYYRDAEGNLEDVRLLTERARLDHEFDSAENEILTRRLENLQKLAEQVGAAHSNLDEQVSDIQSQIDDARAEIESMRYISYETQVQSGFGSKKMTVVMENPYYALMIAKIDLAERKFKDNAALSYFSLANMENVSKGRIEAAAMEALTNLNRQRNVCLVQILRKELTTVIYDAYVRYLGRLPSTQELSDLIESLAQKSTLDQKSYTLDMSKLKTDLESRPDRIERVQEITDIVNEVLKTIEERCIDPTDRANLINALGLTNEQIVDLANILDSTGNATGDWKAIKEYILKNQAKTMHFGQSAFLVLKELVDDYYKEHPEAIKAGETEHERYVRLAVNAMLIDILTGVMNPFTTGDLQLSIFALSKAAAVEGLDIQAYKLDWQDLVSRTADYIKTGKEKVIVHMNSNHYVIVVGIDAENKITYYEPNMGEKGETITISKAEFMKIWKGYALSERAPPEASKKLTSFQAQKIRGSDIFLIISAILSIISFVLSFIDNEFCQMLSKILAIAAVVCCGIEIIGAFVNTVKSIATSMTAFKDLFTISFAKIGDFFANTLPNFFSKIFVVSSFSFGIASISEMATNVFSAVVTMVHTITIQRGLEFLGVDPTIARIATAFVSAGMPSFGAGAFSLQNAFVGLAIEGTRQLCDVFDVPPVLSSVISIAAGSIVDAGLNGIEAPVLDAAGNIVKDEAGNIIMRTLTGLDAISYIMSTTVLSTVTGELACYGITKVGELLGVDNRISYLAGVGIRSTVNAGLTHDFMPDEIWDSVTEGMLNGITGLAMDYASQTLGLDPLISTFAFRAISGAIEGALEYGDIFKGVFEAATNSTGKYLCLGGEGNDPWSRAVYISRVLDFAQTVSSAANPTQGLIDALTKYAITIYSQETMNSIWGQGGIADMVTGRAIVVTDDIGRTVKRIYVDDAHKEYIDIDAATNMFCGKKFIQKSSEGNKEITITELYNVDILGHQVLAERDVIEKSADGSLTKLVFDGQGNLISSIQFNATGREIQKITSTQGAAGIDLNSEGGLENGQIEYGEAGIKLIYQDGEMINAGLVEGTFGSGTTNLAYALDIYDNPLFDISSYDREAAKQDFGLFAHEVVREWKTSLGLSDEIANRVEDKLTNSGYNVIDNPQLYESMLSSIEEVSTMPGVSIQCAADLGTVIQQKAQEWGVNLSLEGGAIKTGLGFLIYFAGDFIGDTLKLGEGTAEAMTLFETGHPIKGTFSILGDLGRATVFTQGLSAIGKALTVTGGVAGTITTSSSNALRNMFRIGEKVYEYDGKIISLVSKEDYITTKIGGIDDLANAYRGGIISSENISRVKILRNADDVNAELRALSTDPLNFKNPYKSGVQVDERIATNTESYVRFWTEGQGNMKGKWLVKKSEVEGLTPQQIKDVLGLENVPTRVADVSVPNTFKLREGIVAEVPEWGCGGGKTQTEVLEYLSDDMFNNARDIGDLFR